MVRALTAFFTIFAMFMVMLAGSAGASTNQVGVTTELRSAPVKGGNALHLHLATQVENLSDDILKDLQVDAALGSLRFEKAAHQGELIAGNIIRWELGNVGKGGKPVLNYWVYVDLDCTGEIGGDLITVTVTGPEGNLLGTGSFTVDDLRAGLRPGDKLECEEEPPGGGDDPPGDGEDPPGDDEDPPGDGDEDQEKPDELPFTGLDYRVLGAGLLLSLAGAGLLWTRRRQRTAA